MKALAKLALVSGLIMGVGAAAQAGNNLCSNPLYQNLPACQNGR